MIDQPTDFPSRALILADAIDLTCGDRQVSYDASGGPADNMGRIAAIFSVISGKPFFTAKDAVLFHMATKLARLHGNPTHRDSAVDLAAYAAIFHECAMAERKPDAA
jgi:hypothetical protein